jgi:hypothetical protein
MWWLLLYHFHYSFLLILSFAMAAIEQHLDGHDLRGEVGWTLFLSPL